MIRGGKLAEPLTEVNMSGDIASLWSNLIAIGNDAYPEGSAHSPVVSLNKYNSAGFKVISNKGSHHAKTIATYYSLFHVYFEPLFL